MNAAEYARYSTGNQTENSIEYQLDAIRKYCAENDITITATYIDRAESGTNTDREDFQRRIASTRSLRTNDTSASIPGTRSIQKTSGDGLAAG